jgi:hypothetical protein
LGFPTSWSAPLAMRQNVILTRNTSVKSQLRVTSRVRISIVLGLCRSVNHGVQSGDPDRLHPWRTPSRHRRHRQLSRHHCGTLCVGYSSCIATKSAVLPGSRNAFRRCGRGSNTEAVQLNVSHRPSRDDWTARSMKRTPRAPSWTDGSSSLLNAVSSDRGSIDS